MTIQTFLHRRLLLGVAAFSLLALAGTATTLATTSSHAQSPTPTDAACAQQDAVPDAADPSGPDTDTIDLQCGDQSGVDAPGSDAAESEKGSAPDTDNIQEGDQTSTGVAGSQAN
ncbi:MAG: hypothetical protein LC118_03355 [Dehalococcoidia bacterium]|nr:hypothetical protein [Dehalococcoidia bacterium]